MRASTRTVALSGALLVGATGIVAANAVSASGSGSPGSGGTTGGTAVSAAPQLGSKAFKIANAMSAAPRSLSRNATVLDYPNTPDGDFVLLRKGSNGWTCVPDDPGTPGNDPICADKQTMKWFGAWLAHKKPHLSSPGLAYMLQGASDASNSDPFATKPAKGGHWHTSPPHVMVFPTEKLPKGTYSADPDNGGPWVMFAGTPYEHYMMPVTAGHHPMGGMDADDGGMGGMGGGSAMGGAGGGGGDG